MIIYNASIKCDLDIVASWLDWMQNGHMKAVIQTGMFTHANLFELTEPQSEDSRTFIAQYYSDSEEKVQQYIQEFAPVLKSEGIEKFGEKFVAFRTIMQKLHSENCE